MFPQPTTTPSNDEIASLLRATRERLVTVGWDRGGITPTTDKPACLYYSLLLAAGQSPCDVPSDVVAFTRRALLDELPRSAQHLGLTAWNDAEDRDVVHVLNVIDKALAKFS